MVILQDNGKPQELSNELQKRCEQCLDILKLPDVHRRLITPFSVYGYDLFHAGSSKSKFGVAVGIPVNFTYKSIADILNDNNNIQVNQKTVDWESEVGKKLANALILPEKVQQFALCREILMCLNHKILLEATYPFTCMFLAYNVSTYLNNKLNLYKMPTATRGILYSIVGLFSLGTYFLMKDMTEVYYETQVDKKLCELGPDFIESGVIFYDKLLQRNQALRELMGSEGERKYSKLGNENYFLRQPRMALIHRKQFFEERLKGARKDSEGVDDGFTST
ncbi:transmembrane protein 177 isoform X2 [Hyposmocoma kahamanoa]|uniref:transmembrane protein 177 isoform X2 n=1 Tax=Hyposmocoma kahamanoa TaxID=1477025 RepID=UPI000E6D8FC4|nr:transmembrane protein 177 isoform X2 [Hyposmocoma kahamanoa]